jgi:hypothetical protein
MVWQVGRRVNSPRAPNAASLIDPVDAQRAQARLFWPLCGKKIADVTRAGISSDSRANRTRMSIRTDSRESGGRPGGCYRIRRRPRAPSPGCMAHREPAPGKCRETHFPSRLPVRAGGIDRILSLEGIV